MSDERDGPPPSSPFTYAPVGGTVHGGLPPGRPGLRVRTRLGGGEAVFRAACDAVMEWRMHRAMGVRVAADAGRAAPGVAVTVGLGVGRVRVYGPCRVVWAVEEERRAGWAYGTLPGHPVRGEEAFVVERHEDGSVWLTVSAFSKPHAWWTRALLPLVRVFQGAYAHRCGQVLRRLSRGGARR
ncbi:DUF1990 domain-containing protein [Streptomyces axinellae]|uniref:DUF1990 domain-containing protein n=1 Tax=Streptomyces axinellae TaxID=552788 RepID=A0ABN3Q9Z4_9ACTN